MFFFCRDKSLLLLLLLSFVAKKIVCRNKIFLCRQNVCHDKQFCRDKSFVWTSILLSRQTRVCRDKTSLLSRQKYACPDKKFVATNACSFVATRHLFNFFVATTMILVASPAIDSLGRRTRDVSHMALCYKDYSGSWADLRRD